jgi:hypothetical protein
VPNLSARSCSNNTVDLDSAMDVEQHFIYDLISNLRKNPKRLATVEKLIRHIDSVTQLAHEGKAARQQIAEAEAALIPACGFNFGLLIPRMFPRYPYDTPLDFSARPFMFAMSAQAPNSVVTLKAGRQVGKCADGATKLKTPDGHTTFLDLFEEGLPL